MDECSEVIPRKFLCCHLCDDEYRQPKFLPCLHTFCRKCIELYIEKHVEEDGYFGCPICYTEASAENGDLSDLPDNLLVRRLSGSTSTTKSREKLCSVCEYSGSMKDASHHCVNCDEFLCSECTADHQRESETLSHKIESITEFEEQKTNRPTTPITPQVIVKCCANYDSLDIGAMFCVDCDVLVCAECHVENHEDHRCAELVAVAQNFEAKIQEPLIQLKEDTELMTSALENLGTEEQFVTKQRSKLKNIIQKRTEHLFSLVHEYEKLLLNEVDRRHDKRKETVKQCYNDVKVHLASVQAVTDLTDKLLTYGSIEEKVIMRKKIGMRVRELCEEELPNTDIGNFEMSLSQPELNVATICELYGELKDKQAKNESTNDNSENSDHKPAIFQQSIDSGQGSDIMDGPEVDYAGEYNSENETDLLSVSNQSSNLQAVKVQAESLKMDNAISSEVIYEQPKRDLQLPHQIQRDCIKGMGMNKNGDIIIGSVAANNAMVYVMEKRGIIRGQIPIEQGWNMHSVASDGKVALTVTKGDNKYKVRILNSDGSVFTDSYLESIGLNAVAANNNGEVIIASNRYGKIKQGMSKTSLSGGNITIYGQNGITVNRITNDDFPDFGKQILEKPVCISVDQRNNIFVCDTGTHSVNGFSTKGGLLFSYRKEEREKPFQGPDSVCTDKMGNIIVTDKRTCRIAVLNSWGECKKTLHVQESPKYVIVTPDKVLVTATADGNIRFYEYL